MTVKEITGILEELAPLAYAEDFDNVGLLVGNQNNKVTGVLVTLDTLEHVVDEAIAKNCNLIVSFHPIIFSGLKSLTGKSYVERTVIKAIQNGISIYSMHTALDNIPTGVNGKICEMLGLINTKILIPKKNSIKKLTTYVPAQNEKKLKEALFKAGAGSIGNYSSCSFSVSGIGTFKPGENSTPTLGTIGELHQEKEVQLSVTYTNADESKVLKSLFLHHPYEEVAYEVHTLENVNQHLGMGMIGELETSMNEKDFLQFVKKQMKAEIVRHSNLLEKPIKKIAVLGGSGAFAIEAAIHSNADIFITGDVKYHDFFKAEGKMLIADIGHYETEQFTKNLIVDYLTKKMPSFAFSLSESVTNPINYY